MLTILIVSVAPKSDYQRCAGDLPADSLERMSQVRRTVAESEIGQTDNLYVGAVGGMIPQHHGCATRALTSRFSNVHS